MEVVARSHRNVELDALRSMSLLYIVGFWHLCSYSQGLAFYETRTTLLLTYCVLGVFCFLSGYLLASRYTIETCTQIPAFLGRRFVRIYPLYFLALVGFLYFGFIDRAVFLASMFLVNMLLGIPLQTLWFVTLILNFYALLPLVLYKYSTARTVLGSLAVYCGLLWTHHLTGRIDLRLGQYLVPFVAGIVTARTGGLSMLSHKAVLAASGMTFVLARLLFSGEATLFQVVVVDIAVLAGIPASLVFGQLLARILPSSTVRFLAAASFATYLLHRITFHLACQIYQPTRISTSVLYLGFFVLPLTVFVGAAAQRVYDRLSLAIFPSIKKR